MNDPATNARFESAVLAPLRGLGRRARVVAIGEGLCLTLALGLGLVVLQYAADRLLRLEFGPRVVLLLGVAGTVVVHLVRYVGGPLRHAVRPDAVAALLPRSTSQARDELVSAVQFATAGPGDPKFNSPALVAALIDRAQTAFASRRWTDIVQLGRLRRWAAILGASLAGAVAAVAVDPAGAAVFAQRNFLLRDTPWPSRTRLVPAGFRDGVLRWPRGDALTLLVDVEGDAPMRGLRMEYRTTGGVSGERTMAAVGQRQFRLDFGPLDESMSVRFVTGGFGIDERTGAYRIEAIDRPSVRTMMVAIAPPEYARQESYRWPAGQTSGDVLAGSAIELQIETNKPVASAELLFAGSPMQAATRISDRTWTTRFTPANSGSFTFDLTDADGLKDLRPATLLMRLTRDRPPRVRLRLPGAGEMIVPRAVLNIAADIEDNLGIASAELVYQLERPAAPGADEATTQPAPASAPASLSGARAGGAGRRLALRGLEPYQTRFAYERPFEVEPLDARPNDRLTLYARATDFNPDTSRPAAPPDAPAANEGRSTAYTLRVVTVEELLAELARRESEWRHEFEAALKAQEKIRDDAAALNETASAGGAANRRAGHRELARRQRQQIARLKNVRRQYQDILAELDVNQLATGAVRKRVEGGIIAPMGRLIDSGMNEAAGIFDKLEREFDAGDAGRAAAIQQRILREMEAILANMVRSEGFNEAVGLLQDLLKLQSEVRTQTQAELERQVDELFGGPASTQPAGR